MLENFMLSLEIMWKGMAGIFTVILLITLLVVIMGKLGGKNEPQEKEPDVPEE
ncbi:hypothetical protein [Anaerolentibacter hominis]|uniref:hypothetical protein n=1 Tax=Anaerolentibacter hominis TaxID=3079009 RepID=UPI0031B84AFD